MSSDKQTMSPPAADEAGDPSSDHTAGRLPAEARRALIELMRQGVVMADSKRLVFDALCHHQALITDHLADMYLRLQLDEAAGLALLLRIDTADTEESEEERPSLISRRLLSLYDSLLLIVLRKHYQERENAGDNRILIDIDTIESRMIPFLPLTASQKRERSQLNGALEQMKKRRILASVRGQDDRLQITPVIRYVVSAAMLEQLLAEYQRVAAEQDMPDQGELDG